MSALTPEAVAALPGAAAAAVAWRTRNQLYLTVIAKATFAFVPGGVMARTAPQEILRAEVHHGNNPVRSVRATADTVPYLSRADVLFTGHAHAPPPGSVRALLVRLAIAGEARCLLDKRLLVQDPRGFQRMPIVYERAVAGVSGVENPLGVETPEQANILYPGAPLRPAGFGPIARAWPARKRLLGSTPRKVLEAPIAEIPEAFDWEYFQAAPPDQRIDFLRGDEWLTLEGLHPTLPRMQTRLPRARARAWVGGFTGAWNRGEPIELYADTLRIDGDEHRCTVVWRRAVPVPNEAMLAAVRVVAGVEIEGEPLAPPESAQIAGGELARPAREVRVSPAGTVVMADAEALPTPRSPSFPKGDVAAAEGDVAVAKGNVAAAKGDVAAFTSKAREFAEESATIVVRDEDAGAALSRRVLPFGTLALSPEAETSAATRPSLPFPASTPPSMGAHAPAASIPGAPWSGEVAPPAPAPSPGFATLKLEDAPSPTSIVAPLPQVGGSPVQFGGSLVQFGTSPPQLGASSPQFSTSPPQFGASPPQDVSGASPASELGAFAADAPIAVSQEMGALPASRFYPDLRNARGIEEKTPHGPPPLSDGEEVTLERCAIVAVDLVERRAPRAEVLRAHGLDEERFRKAEQRWNEAMAQEAKDGARALRDRYDAASVRALETHRGPIRIEEYARLRLAAEQKRLAAALEEMSLRRSLWARVVRTFEQRIAEDPQLESRLKREIARLRAAAPSGARPSTGAHREGQRHDAGLKAERHV